MEATQRYRLRNGAPSVRPVSCADVTVLKLNPKGTKVRRATELPLPRAFYARDAVTVARDLLGKLLVRHEAESTLIGRIVEVEAYLEEQDLAAHSAVGPTSRNNVLFGPPGHAYVYFIYGNHYCLNISCEPEGKAGSVLIRALEPLTGIAEMAKKRGVKMRHLDDVRDLKKLTSGPGRLAEALGITRARHNGADLTDKTSGLWVASDSCKVGRIAVTARIGISKAADLPLRFVIAGDAFISGKRMPEIDF